ncbi:hypothetical protein D3C71_1901010 [compost metagenome]
MVKPSTALYWHIGGTAMRLRSVTSLRVNGENNADMLIFFWTEWEMARRERPQASAVDMANAAGPLQQMAAPLK